MKTEVYLWAALFALGGAVAMVVLAEQEYAHERRRAQDRYRSAVAASEELGQQLHDLEGQHRPGFVAPPDGPAEDVRG